MDRSETRKLIDALKTSAVTVTFKKINTDEIRIMPCTLNDEILSENGVQGRIKDFDPNSEHLAAWALDKKGWRSFRLETVISWELKNEPLA